MIWKTKETLVMTNQVLSVAGIELDATASSKEEAVALCADKLISLNAVQPEYKEAMWERENIISSYVGQFIAIPHGTNESRQIVNFDQIVFIRFNSEIPWGDGPVRICCGIASKNDQHIEILGNLAQSLMFPNAIDTLLETKDKQQIIDLLTAKDEA